MKNPMSRILKFVRIFSLVILIFIPIVISSCYVDYDLATNGIPIVASFFNPDYNFNNVTKYYFLDTVVQINGASVTRAYDNTIKNATINNLNALGWTRITDSSMARDPGVVVVGNVVTTTSYTVTVENGCWGGIWSYSSCYSYDTDYNYSTGTIGIVIVDVNVLNGESLPIQWIGLTNGVIGSGGNISQKITDGINKAFSLSPYL